MLVLNNCNEIVKGDWTVAGKVENLLALNLRFVLPRVSVV